MKPSKNGKVSISEKGKQPVNVASTIPGAPKSLTDIPNECQSELKNKGLEARWVDIVELKKNHGYHKNEWRPYKFECLTNEIKNNPFADSGNGFEGFLIRKQLVLAVKGEEDVAKQRAYIKFKNSLQANPTQKAVNAFKEYAASEKNMKVEEWSDNDEKET